MAAMPLPLQLKSWKGCIAELMAQPSFRVSCKEMGVQAGNEVWDRPSRRVYSLQLGVSSARSPSFIAAAPSNVCRDYHVYALAQREAFVCC